MTKWGSGVIHMLKDILAVITQHSEEFRWDRVVDRGLGVE
jgi:hypothetical protein